MICINVGAPRQRYKLRARKKIRLRTKSGTFHDLAGRGSSGKKNGTVPPKAGRLAGLRVAKAGSSVVGTCPVLP